ncbi:MAG: putative Type pilus pilin [Parcubacteria group bacterium]|nr:putative Type pilus pilin [Parcubacteria group bacterium]
MYSTSRRGFSLLELIVSVAIFSMVMLAVTSAYLTLIALDRETRATNDLSTNLSFAMESMSRAIRTGTNYLCLSGGDGSTCSRFSFTDNQGQAVVYFLKTTDGTVARCVGSGACNDNTAISLTDPRIKFDATSGLRFAVHGAGSTADQDQPYVTIALRGTMVASPTRSISFAIQTGVSQRTLDL